MVGSDSWPGLLGRRRECDALSALLSATRAGRSQVLVLRGAEGIGKTALLDFLVRGAAGCRIGLADGALSETALDFAGLHQLCYPMLDRLDELPGQLRDALATAFRLRPGAAPDPFLVGVAVLTLFRNVAGEKPLVCVVDDAQWLDHSSASALEFVARRLTAEPIAMVFAVREPDDEARLAGLPELVVRGLGGGDAVALLGSAVTGRLDAQVRDRILAESHGNPLALLDLPRGLSAAELAFGGTTEAGTTPLAHRIEHEVVAAVGSLQEQSRLLLVLAAAEPVGDVPLLWRAAERLRIGSDAVVVAEAAGLIELRDLVRFRHPLARAAVYRSATPGERRAVHHALAEATDPGDLVRRAWHHARAAASPDESVAAELEDSANRAFEHGGLAAVATFLQEAAALTSDPAQRVRRSLEAADAKVRAGALDDALALLGAARNGPIDHADRAHLDLLAAEISYAASCGSEAVPLLLAAARRLESIDVGLARDTYFEALSASLLAGRLASGPDTRRVAEAIRRAPLPHPPRKGDALLESLAVLFTTGYGPAAPLSARAVKAFLGEDLTLDEVLRFGWLGSATAASLWDDVGWDALSHRHLDVAREAGAVGALPLALQARTLVQLFTGELDAAAVLVEETRSAVEVMRGDTVPVPYGEIGLLAVRGHQDEAEPMIQGCLDDVTERGEGLALNVIHWARAMLFNSLGRYTEAVGEAREATADPREFGAPKWALAELVEAGVRSGDTRAAEAALEQLAEMTRVSGTDWALGIEAGRRALLREGRGAEDLYREAVERLGRTRMRVDSARAQLVYGEWLRRQGRRGDARTQLRAAHDVMTTIGADAFAARARNELHAAGETVRRRRADASGDLTPQEAHIARLAADGLTNPEIGAALFISPRTVEWHLRKALPKLGVSTRRQLKVALADLDGAPSVV